MNLSESLVIITVSLCLSMQHQLTVVAVEEVAVTATFQPFLLRTRLTTRVAFHGGLSRATRPSRRAKLPEDYATTIASG